MLGAGLCWLQPYPCPALQAAVRVVQLLTRGSVPGKPLISTSLAGVSPVAPAACGYPLSSTALLVFLVVSPGVPIQRSRLAWMKRAEG